MEKVWLITTKDVEYLFDLDGKEILFNLNNCLVHNISDYTDEYNLTLIDYYSDYLNIIHKTVFHDVSDNRKSIEEITKHITEKIPSQCSEPSSSLFNKIFQLSDSYVFLTRCFPNTLIPDNKNHINNNQLKAYWLISYANTVAKIIKKSFSEIEFFGILHSSDTIDSTYNHEMQKKSISISRKGIELEMNICLIKYSHDINDNIYHNVILNTSFFSNMIDDDIHIHILKSIELPGILERSKILKAAGLGFESDKIKQYFLGCDNNNIANAEENFKKLFNKNQLELL